MRTLSRRGVVLGLARTVALVALVAAAGVPLAALGPAQSPSPSA